MAHLWVGPLAWAPIGIALFAAFGRRDDVRGSGGGQMAGSVQLRMWAAAFLTIVVGAVAAWSAAPRVPGGDEPAYLIITQSLIKDGDLRIQNNHNRGDYREYYPGHLPRADAIVRDRANDEAYSIHAPGLPALLVPFFAVLGYRGAVLALLIGAGITSAVIWNLGWRATRSSSAAWFAWGAIAGSTTFVLQSFLIYPDGPGALAVALAIWLLLRLREPGSPARLVVIVAVSGALAVLPWLHSRFAVIAAGFGLAIVWSLVRATTLPRADAFKRVAAFAALPVVSASAWFAYFWILYGTPSPSAPYGTLSGPDGMHASYAPGGLLALLFDQQFGLLAYAPVLAVAAVGLAATAERGIRRAAAVSLAIAFAYALITASVWMWWAGTPGTPARFLTAVLPVLAIPLALAWRWMHESGRAIASLLVLVSIAITALVIGVDRAGLAWNDRDALAAWLEWLSPIANLTRAFPSFFLKLTPGEVASELPFAAHALVSLAIAAGSATILALLARRSGWAAERCRLAAAVWFVLALSAVSITGWQMTGARSLDPARSQLRLLNVSRDGRRIVEIGPGVVRRLTRPEGRLNIRAEDPGRRDRRVWASWGTVPAGVYQLRFRLVTPDQGQATVTIGSSAAPLRILTLLPLTAQSFTVTLPAGASALTVVPDEGLWAAGGTVELMPFELRTEPKAFALATQRYESIEAYFMDAHAYPEAQGFWVEGGQATDVILVPPPGQQAPRLALRNGNAANVVSVASGRWQQRVELQIGQERELVLPVPDANGQIQVRVESASGFMPATVTAGSADRRILGVFVSVK